MYNNVNRIPHVYDNTILCESMTSVFYKSYFSVRMTWPRIGIVLYTIYLKSLIETVSAAPAYLISL